jgi:cell division protein ZapA (FtsZ GTPase activity inhibitor)
MNELNISVVIAERPYKLVIEKEHEEFFRKAAKLIDKRVKDYSSSYAYKDKQDLLAMVALEMTTQSLKNENGTKEQEKETMNHLKKIEGMLDQCFQQSSNVL